MASLGDKAIYYWEGRHSKATKCAGEMIIQRASIKINPQNLRLW